MQQTLEQSNRLLEDPIVARLVDVEAEPRRTFLGNVHGLEATVSSPFRSVCIMRTRYTEDCRREAVERGVRQYVNLGAGLDTFPFRQPPWAQQLKILR